MSFIDWNAAALPSQIAGQQQQNAQQQLQQVQTARALNALRGINVGDQSSVQGGINALTGLGMFDQASALTNLAQTRAINQASLPVTTGALSLAQQAIDASGRQQQSSEQPSQDQDIDTAHRQILQQGADAVNDLLSYQDPTLRAAAADVYRQKFAQMGIPQQNIDEVLGDLSDRGLKAHEAFLTGAASGNTAIPHPTGFAASQALLNSDPAYRTAEGTLSGPFANPLVQAALSKYAGLDLSPGMGQALTLTGPARAEAAHAALAPTIAGTTAQASAIGSGSVGTPPVPGARLTPDGTGWILPGGVLPIVQGVAQAGALGSGVTTPVTVPTGIPGQTKVESATQFAGGAPAVSATAAQTTGAVGGAEANTQQANEFERVGAGAVVRKGNLDNLRQEASEFTAGPQSPFWAHLGALASEYGITPPGPIPKDNAVAAQAEFDKISKTILGQQRAALGLPATDQSTSISQGATPNDTMTAKGIQRVSGILEGNEDYINAGYQAWTTWKQQGHGYETFQQFLPQWNRMFSPRIFQAQYMDSAEAKKVAATVPNYAAQVSAAKRLGYIAAQ